MRRLSNKSGFTLIELLIVIVIIGILATIAMAMLWRAKDRSLVATLQGDLKVAAVHQENYFSKHYGYAPEPDSLVDFSASPGVTVTITHRAADGWAATAEHHSLAGQRCGLLVGAAPVGTADPALQPGVVTCGPY